MKKPIFILLLTAYLSSCATVMSKNEYAVTIQSVPEGADFTITNRKGNTIKRGTTPDTVTLKSSSGYFKGEKYLIRFSKQGYPDKTFELNSTISGWYMAGNFIFGGLLGWLVIDPATGSMFNLPNSAVVSLQVQESSQPHTEGQTLKITTIDQLNENEIKELKPIKKLE